MVELKSNPVGMMSIWDSLIYKMSEKLTSHYATTGNINANDVERLNKLKDKRDEAIRSQ
jgi:hypothetical protein